MIDHYEIRGFKRFRDNSFEMAPLTVLAGLNGSGKTSFIQGLLLMREASIAPGSETVSINGPFGLELGVAEDIRNWESGDEISFIARVAGERKVWRFGVPLDEALYLSRVESPISPPAAFSIAPRVFTYLSAERLGPRSVLSASALPGEALEVGTRGEYCAQLLSLLGSRPLVEPGRLHPERPPEEAALLKYEIERWLGEIVRPVEIEAEQFPRTSVIGLRFRSPGGDWVRAPNMGFGVSYALPIVVAGLVAPSGGLVIIENPEAHLHPAGQSRMGVFLAWLAKQGVQVLIETHSDHVINGIRRAIGEYHYLNAKDAVVHFFDNDGDDECRTTRLGFTQTGGVTDWPRRFFDQFQVDVAALGRVRRQR